MSAAAQNRLVAPCSKLAFGDWWKTTAADRFIKVSASALGHRRFWDAMHAVSLEDLEEISRRIALRIIGASGVDVSSVALDMTNFCHLHRHRQRQGPGRPAGQGQAEAG
jgi:hypothetical protein